MFTKYNQCRRAVASMAAILVVASASAQNARIIVSNPTALLRSDETIEIPLESVKNRLTTDGSQGFVVRNLESGAETPSQVTYDKKLIFQVSLQGNASANFDISNGTPQDVQPKVFGAHYPNRLDDIAWESDRIAFRIYGPKLQQTKERAFGNDVWVKSVPDLIVDYRYDLALNPATLKRIDSLKKCDINAARALSNSTSYHVDHGNGMDHYTVGPTLGAATAALMHNDTIIYPYCFKEFEILDQGALRFTVKLTYNPMTVGDTEGVVETRTISIDAGSQLNKTTLHYSNLKATTPIISGLIMGEKEGVAQYTTSKEGGYATYATPPKKGKEEVQGTTYVATIFGASTTKAEPYYFTPEESKRRINKTGYAALFGDYLPGTQFTYYWGAAWSRYNFSSYQQWVEYVSNYAQRVREPLSVTIK